MLSGTHLCLSPVCCDSLSHQSGDGLYWFLFGGFSLTTPRVVSRLVVIPGVHTCVDSIWYVTC